MANLAAHRRVRFDYDILDTYEAGLVLHGYEVKAIRSGKVKLEGGHIIIRGGEAYLVGISISPYQPKNTPESYDPERARTLLLSRKELRELEEKSEQRGLTIVPIRLYNKSGIIKLEIAVARGKKKADKRETMRARDSKRDIERTLKGQ